MTDTLRKALGRHLFHTGYENKNSEEIAEGAIAFIAAWALEPAQVEKAARLIASRRGLNPDALMQSLMAGVYGQARMQWEDFADDANAAIGALFGEKT